MKIDKVTLVGIISNYRHCNIYDEHAVNTILFYIRHYWDSMDTQQKLTTWFKREELIDLNAYLKLAKYIFEKLNQTPKMKYKLNFVNDCKQCNGHQFWYKDELIVLFQRHEMNELYETKIHPIGMHRWCPEEVFTALEK